MTTFIQTRWLRTFQTEQKVKAYQEKKIAEQMKYMKKHSPFFSRWNEVTLPTMDKNFMMTHFDELNTVGLKKEEALAIALMSEETREFEETIGDISVGLSSGTSGHRGLFVTSQTEQAIWAGTMLAKMLPEKQLLHHKLAFFLRADNNLYQTINSKVIQLTYFDMYQSMIQHILTLNEYQPSILIAPASVLVELGKAVEAGNLSINPIKVISVAEILEERDKTYLKKVFQQNVIHQVYQCTEGFLGCTCSHGTLHLNEDLVKIDREYLDDRRFYPIITDFTRTSQPIINYRLNDILVLSQERCPCGSAFQAIEKIEGRSDDIFVFKGKKQAEIRVFPDFIRRCILFVPNIREYQVIQRSPHQIEIHINDVTTEQREQMTTEFSKLAEDLEFEDPTLLFVPYGNEFNKKLKRISRIKLEEK